MHSEANTRPGEQVHTEDLPTGTKHRVVNYWVGTPTHQVSLPGL